MNITVTIFRLTSQKSQRNWSNVLTNLKNTQLCEIKKIIDQLEEFEQNTVQVMPDLYLSNVRFVCEILASSVSSE